MTIASAKFVYELLKEHIAMHAFPKWVRDQILVLENQQLQTMYISTGGLTLSPGLLTAGIGVSSNFEIKVNNTELFTSMIEYIDFQNIIFSNSNIDVKDQLIELNYNMLGKILKISSTALSLITESNRTPMICKIAIENSYDNYKFIPNQLITEEFNQELALINPAVLKYIPRISEEFIIEYYEKFQLSNIQCQSFEIIMKYLEKNKWSIIDIKEHLLTEDNWREIKLKFFI